MKIRKNYIGRCRCRIAFEGESLTKQCFKGEVDINTIIARANRTGLLVDPSSIDFSRVGKFDDCGGDFQAIQNRIAESKTLFESLPSAVRRKFRNDPVKFVEFAEDEKNCDEMVKMGLMNPVEKESSKESSKEPSEVLRKEASPELVLPGEKPPVVIKPSIRQFK